MHLSSRVRYLAVLSPLAFAFAAMSAQAAQREAWRLAPDLATAIASPELAFGATTKIYAPYVLCRSVAVWRVLPHFHGQFG